MLKMTKQMVISDIITSMKFEAPISWRYQTGRFSVDGHEFAVSIRPSNKKEEEVFIPYFCRIPKTGFVDFFLIQSDRRTTKLSQLSIPTAMKLFSAVAHGISNQIKKSNFEVLIFVAKKLTDPEHYDTRVWGYEMIVERAARKNGMLSAYLPSKPGTAVLVMFHPKYVKNMIAVGEFLQERIKI